MTKQAKLSIQLLFIEWTWAKILGLIAIAGVISLVIFVSLNVAVAPHKELVGKIVSIGMDTATYYTLPKIVINVELDDGKTASVYVPSSINVKKEQLVVIQQSRYLISGGIKYKFIKVKVE